MLWANIGVATKPNCCEFTDLLAWQARKRRIWISEALTQAVSSSQGFPGDLETEILELADSEFARRKL